MLITPPVKSNTPYALASNTGYGITHRLIEKSADVELERRAGACGLFKHIPLDESNQMPSLIALTPGRTSSHVVTNPHPLREAAMAQNLAVDTRSVTLDLAAPPVEESTEEAEGTVSRPGRDAILDSAAYLFGQSGYRAVTVRDIAAEAGVSAALVMKLFLSKEKLFAAVRPNESVLTELDVPSSELGRALVRRMLVRRERGMQEPWAIIPFAALDAPNSNAARADIRERYLDAIARLISDSSADRRFASTVTSLMIGFSESIRTLGLFSGWNINELVSHYGAVVQTQIDACEAAS